MLDHSKAFTNTQVFKGDDQIVPELKQLVTQTRLNQNLIFLMADIALRYTVKTSFTNCKVFLTDEGV